MGPSFQPGYITRGLASQPAARAVLRQEEKSYPNPCGWGRPTELVGALQCRGRFDNNTCVKRGVGRCALREERILAGVRRKGPPKGGLGRPLPPQNRGVSSGAQRNQASCTGLLSDERGSAPQFLSGTGSCGTERFLPCDRQSQIYGFPRCVLSEAHNTWDSVTA